MLKKSIHEHIERLFATHGADKILIIIEHGLYSGQTLSKIRDELCRQLNESIPPRVLPKLFDEWFPEIFEMSKADRRNWVNTYWPMARLEHHKWAQLHDVNHPVFKHFTRKNLVNYAGQKSMAKKRGIDFKFDFLSWVTWWISTGHFAERGVLDHQYQMCRKGDTGPYEWDNVYCDTGANNKQLMSESMGARLGKSTTIDGIVYESISDASRKLNIDRRTARRKSSN